MSVNEKYDLELLRMVVSAVTDGIEQNVVPSVWLQIKEALADFSKVKCEIKDWRNKETCRHCSMVGVDGGYCVECMVSNFAMFVPCADAENVTCDLRLHGKEKHEETE